ncbi:hypothetical protein BAUCODRAFT_35155 [Baudoinia panamericana UAMH 10762]|uniref:Uncharacterized protein n=1 Tax=Baudoinia panamericana (strain UAMH 10762) TaxID=717646 RepID=M2MUB5_BAUPA|nr:uncharacterized protein BAUCODRAFT_35155 [Baudoinia panamericana UAMH 10762]EMC95163.1 hypothetical protein BAUCODRAFT_35155 [Baudoinia panamericana UAMH 10762]
MSDDRIHSTGRGGAGNIGQDPNTVYVDGDIVREGVEGETSRSSEPVGRGGAGNVLHSPRTGTPAAGINPSVPPSKDFIPETATRTAEGHENFHTGRGGQGNVHKDKYGGHSTPQPGQQGHHEDILGKAKHALGFDKGEPTQGSGLKNETAP